MSSREMWRRDVVAEIEERQGSAAITLEKTGERFSLNAYTDEGDLTFTSFLGDEPKVREFILEAYSALGLDADKDADEPQLPTTPGVYEDRDGDYWLLESGEWTYIEAAGDPGLVPINDPENYLPFVRLVPETTN